MKTILIYKINSLVLRLFILYPGLLCGTYSPLKYLEINQQKAVWDFNLLRF